MVKGQLEVKQFCIDYVQRAEVIDSKMVKITAMDAYIEKYITKNEEQKTS